MRLRGPATALVLACALGACGGGADTRPAAGELVPDTVLKAAQAALVASRTGVAGAEVAIDDPRTQRPAVTYVWNGAFDVSSQRWRTTFRQNSPDESGQVPEVGFTYVGDDRRAFGRPEYLDRSPTAGDWVRGEITSDQAGPRFSVDLPAILEFAHATAVRSDNGGRTIVTTVPLGIALQILGFTKGANVFEVDLPALTGHAELQVVLDQAGLPVGATMHGSSATGVESLPVALAEIVANSRWRVTLSGLGEPVNITLPRAAKRVDDGALEAHLERQKRAFDESAAESRDPTSAR